ncbi:MAG: hypothetical protein BWY46_01850 [Firmicutes bacterium ADurb.Bin300]|nr:MAG: hypothetical protein BWY46_01850 [Firmicutes bacterium ADurb.Bin300]
MARVINHANLPSAPVKLCAIGAGNAETKISLQRLGISVIEPKPSDGLSFAEKTHSDMLMLHLGRNEIILSKEQEDLKKQLEAFGFTPKMLKFHLRSEYPLNVTLNAAIIKDKFFAHKASIKYYSGDYEFNFYAVKQGYAKCSCCIINDNAVITEDEGISLVMKKAGLDVLKIKKGEIKLRGMSYGFFGGATGKLSSNILAINGELRYNSDKKNISAFLKNYQIDVISLKSGPPEDIGGIIPLLEEEK